jgi:hypothetical protein
MADNKKRRVSFSRPPPQRSGVACSNAAPRSGIISTMRRSSYVMCTASRFYRGYRIKAVQLGYTWHASVHGRTRSIVKHIEATTLVDAMGQAEWFIETRFAFRPPHQRSEQMAG